MAEDLPGVLALMGSGETSPTMVEVHRSLAGRLGPDAVALLLDTPYAFQENASVISARARRYFARSVGLAVRVAGAAEDLGRAGWVFSGPGSPTFALDRWAQTAVAAGLRARLQRRRGVTVLASAAACTAGAVTVPVYEIYKVGAEPHWRDGLDLLGTLGLPFAVIPHYDNAEGGTHDTRYCYLGERRLALMERRLDDEVAVLGIDEHTAVVFDLGAETVEVRGRGGLTVRRRGTREVLPSGTVIGLAELRDLATDIPGPTLVAGGAATAPEPARVTLGEVARACVSRFDAAVPRRDTEALTMAVLDLEAEIAGWAADTEQDDDGVEWARALLRELIARLARMADPREPRERLAPVADPLIALRARLRERGAYDVADAVREALAQAGVAVEDTPRGPRWDARP